MSGVNFMVKEWDDDVLHFEISLVDASPDGVDENVFCVKVGDREVYFEAHAESEVWEILQCAINAVKELSEYEPF